MTDRDSLFEEALRDGLAARTSDLEAPEGLGRSAVRASRRRSARRAAMVGLPWAAAAAVVLTFVAAGGGHHARHLPTAAQTPASAHPPMTDARFVVKRVRVQIAHLGASDRVQEIVTSSWHHQISARFSWTDPKTHVKYTQMQRVNKQGDYALIYWGRERLVSGDRVTNIALRIDRVHKTYSITRSTRPVEVPTVPRIGDPAREIAQALNSDDVHLCPNEMIGGQKARCLLLRYGRGTTSRLWVNARTYRPINQTIFHRDPKTHRLINYLNLYLRPATRWNIAQAKDRPVFKGYTRVPYR